MHRFAWHLAQIDKKTSSVFDEYLQNPVLRSVSTFSQEQ